MRPGKGRSVDPTHLRILFTPPRYPPYVGGVEEHCRGYARTLAWRGHDVRISCAEDGPSPALVDCIPVRRCRTAFKVANTNITPGLPLHLAVAEADIIHTFLPTPWSADCSAIVGRLRRRPVVVSYANDIVGQGAAAPVAAVYNRVLLPLTLAAADRILVSSGRNASSPHLRRFRRKIEVLPPGVDTHRFCPDVEPRWPSTVFFLSVLDEYHRYKGLAMLLQAMALVVQQLPDARLVVGGTGPLQSAYEDMACQLGIAGTVQFLGHVPDAQVLEMYRRCTAFVLPSTSADQEGFGIVAAEAMACGAPVIVSNVVPLAAHIARDAEGTVVQPSDKESLAAALIRRCQAPPDTHASDGPAIIRRHHSLTAMGARLERLYRSLVDQAAC